MMKLILSILILSTTVACGSGGGGSPTLPKQAVNDSSGPGGEPMIPIDYSKIACGDVEECATTCMITAPYADDEYIRTLCKKNSFGDATCNAFLKEENDSFYVSYLSCVNSATSARIDTGWIGSQQCSTDATCQQACAKTFQPETDTAILNRAAANGGRQGGAVTKELIANQRIREQLAACLDAPVSYVISK